MFKINKNSNVFIHNTVENCNVSYNNFDKLQVFLLINWYTFVDDVIKADVVIINTCWWNKITQNSFRWLITDLNTYLKPTIFFWCLELLNNYDKSTFDFETEYIYTKYLYKIWLIFENTKLYTDINSIDIDLHKKLLVKWNSEKRYFLEISSWCIHNCTFCWIKKIVWNVISRPIDEIINEFKTAVSSWFKEIVLLSEDSWSYGYDIWSNFTILFNEMVKIEWDYTINIHYYEPSMLLKDFSELKNNLHKISKIVVPIQSFSNRILKLMNRKYLYSDIINLINNIKKINPEIYIENHIIFWYPTETNEEFEFNIKSSLIYDDTSFNPYSDHSLNKKIFTDNDNISDNEMFNRYKKLKLLWNKFWKISVSWNDKFYPWKWCNK